MFPTIEMSLEAQTECPKCGFNWQKAENWLYETVASKDYHLAIRIIKSCDVCSIRFKKELERLVL